MRHHPNGPRDVPDRSSSGDETVARLIRLAGHRPAVPAADAATVKEAARAEWRRAVTFEKQRRRFYRGAGGLLAAAAAVVLVLNVDTLRDLWPGAPVTLATVETLSGTVNAALGDGGASALAPGDALRAGSVVETGEAPADAAPPRAAFRLAGGASVRLDAGTRVRWVSRSVLELDRGAVYVDTDGDPRERALEVRTPLGIARDVGTRFEVRLDDAASRLVVRVREGEVDVSREGEVATRVGAGFEVAVRSGEPAVPVAIEPYLPLDDWSLAVLPAFDVRGRPAREFLVWAAEQGGWELRFDGPDAESAAAETVYGEVLGLSLGEALEVVLLGSSLRYRLDDGVLRIETAG